MKKTMKFITLLLLVVLSVVGLAGCSTTETTSSGNKEETIPTIKVGETWEVEGQWRLTINSVERTSERNQFSDKNPQDVVYITYTYENIGYEDKNGIMDGLYLDLGSGQIVDSNGEMGYTYPDDITNYPQQVPVGAKCTNVQTCIGLNNKSDSFTINFSQYDGNTKNRKVKFELDIQ